MFYRENLSLSTLASRLMGFWGQGGEAGLCSDEASCARVLAGCKEGSEAGPPVRVLTRALFPHSLTQCVSAYMHKEKL